MTTYTLEVGSINARDVTTRFGPKKAYDLIAADGTKYGFGFTDPARSGISVGTTISAVGTVGKYGVSLDPKTVSLGKVAGAVSGATAPSPAGSSRPSGGYGQRPFPVPLTNGDTAIIRQNALTNAVATVADFVATQPTEKWPDLDTWTDMVISTAYKYAEFSSGQREVKKAKALQGVMTAEEIHTAVEESVSQGDDDE